MRTESGIILRSAEITTLEHTRTMVAAIPIEKAEITLVCLKTLYPHQYKAYQEIVTLAPIVSGDCAPLLFDNLPKTLKTISLINKELRLAYNETVQNE